LEILPILDLDLQQLDQVDLLHPDHLQLDPITIVLEGLIMLAPVIDPHLTVVQQEVVVVEVAHLEEEIIKSSLKNKKLKV